ncbi:DUF1987 domain-containing protein [Magnetofaba australis]|uniref:SiaC family regulatory phosphoprotein domain-containing protein n=1 Tax=Magnetofaba australis IT-1 TaxID=1434232 RepID=A0A1Y2K6M3_9PROT|nr:DUF1987 domain-containing protein [Magnetofaba australis]OSM04091.1 hypothetical protein MAIT1_03648 [Magnetofaba australis IT-1]
MENIVIEATERAPELRFDFAAQRFSMKGESYPEDVSAFFGAPIESLQSHLRAQEGAAITFDFELVYFNSSSAKVLMRIFDMLEEAASNGNTVVINWRHLADDDNMAELGEEFGEDLEEAEFNLVEVEEA